MSEERRSSEAPIDQSASSTQTQIAAPSIAASEALAARMALETVQKHKENEDGWKGRLVTDSRTLNAVTPQQPFDASELNVLVDYLRTLEAQPVVGRLDITNAFNQMPVSADVLSRSTSSEEERTRAEEVD